MTMKNTCNFCWHDWEPLTPDPTSGGTVQYPVYTHRCKRCGKRGFEVKMMQAEDEFQWRNAP